MSDERWTIVDRLFDAALEREPHERAAFLDDACANDEALRREVESLLAHELAARGFLDTPPLAAMLGDSDDSDERMPVGCQLGPYRILDLLGEGGMGAVYKATDTRLGRTVAIKILHHRQHDDLESAQRFEREAMAVAALRHPHVCVLHDIRSDDGIEYLVMEYLDGETLAQRIARGPLPLPDVLRCAVEIASALAETHRNAIVHRDIKPGNIMLTASGAKLLDFGIAKRHTDPWAYVNTGSDLSPLRSLLRGTPHYMAPEQIEGKPIDVRTDIFAFGAVLYEAISGRTAFPGDTVADLKTAILERHPAPIPTQGSAGLETIARFIRRCLQKDPADRWQTSEDMLFELRGISGNAPFLSRVRAPRTLLVSAAVIGGVLLVAAIFLRNSSNSIIGVSRPSSMAMPPPAAREPSLTVGSLQQLTAAEELEIDPSFSPDGRLVAYSAGRATQMRIVIREMGSNRTSTLPVVGRTVSVSTSLVTGRARTALYHSRGGLGRVSGGRGSATD